MCCYGSGDGFPAAVDCCWRGETGMDCKGAVDVERERGEQEETLGFEPHLDYDEIPFYDREWVIRLIKAMRLGYFSFSWG